MFKHKVAVVTGAGSGIGRALAQQLAAAGARLALSDINRAVVEETLRMLPAGSDARAYVVAAAEGGGVNGLRSSGSPHD